MDEIDAIAPIRSGSGGGERGGGDTSAADGVVSGLLGELDTMQVRRNQRDEM